MIKVKTTRYILGVFSGGKLVYEISSQVTKKTPAMDLLYNTLAGLIDDKFNLENHYIAFDYKRG